MTAAHSPRNICITGALGFIGRRLAERLRADGHTVSGVDMRAAPELGVVAGDVTRPGPWQEAFAGADLVVHTAAVLGMDSDEERFWRVNCIGTRHVLDAAGRAGAGRLVHLSSIVAFGFDYPDGVDEKYPLRTNGVPYVDTKVASEQVVLQAHAAGEVPCTIVRPGDVYGPGSNFWTVLPVREIAAGRFMLPAMGEGHLSPVFVDDLIEGIILAATTPNAAGQVFTMTGGETVTTGEFFGHYARMLGVRPPRRVPTWLGLAFAATAGRMMSGGITTGAVRYVARRGGYSIEKARTQLGYRPAVDLAEGMRCTEAWLRDAGLVGGQGSEARTARAS